MSHCSDHDIPPLGCALRMCRPRLVGGMSEEQSPPSGRGIPKLFSRVNFAPLWRAFQRDPPCSKVPLTLACSKHYLVCSISRKLSIIAQDGKGRGCLSPSGNHVSVPVAKVVTQLSWIVLFSITRSRQNQAVSSCSALIAVCSLWGKKSAIIDLIGTSAPLCKHDKCHS